MYCILAFLTILPALQAPQDPPQPGPAPSPAVETKPAEEKREAAFPERTASIEALRRHLATRVAERRAKAQAAVGELMGDLSWNYDENKDIVEKRIAAIVSQGPLVSELLVEALVPSNGEKEKRNLARNAARCLHRMGDVGVLPDLVRLTEHSAAEVRSDAAFALGGIRDARSVQALMTLLDDKEERVVVDAARALAELRAEPAAPAIAARLASIKNEGSNFRTLVAALADIGSANGADLVLAALPRANDSDTVAEFVRYAKRTRAESFASPLFDLLADSNRATVQERILEALGYIAAGDRRILSGLKEYLENRSYSVRSAAAIALYRQKDKSGLDKLLAQPEETIERSPREPWGYLARARVYLQLEEWHKASLDYRKAADRVPRGEHLEPEAVCEWAQCYAEQKQWEKALKTLKDEKVPPSTFAAWPGSKNPCFDRLREDPRHAEWFTVNGG